MHKYQPSAIETIVRTATAGPALGTALFLLFVSAYIIVIEGVTLLDFIKGAIAFVPFWLVCCIPGYVFGVPPAVLYGGFAHLCLSVWGFRLPVFLALWTLLCASVMLLLWWITPATRTSMFVIIGCTALAAGLLYPLCDKRFQALCALHT